ncbi:MAG: glycosyl transferase family 2 [Bacteroidetes bacterium]|nr:glycosyl transferase family 2 [Bacteroidota bacterium]|tara:strand:- start:55 stop:771 length:717 start_codon:yes stop_codon:yes gene_type:complete
MKILVIIPAYNEAESIGNVISSFGQDRPELDLLVVNDGSIDETSDIVRKYENVKLIELPFNLGIGGCVHCGFIYAAANNYDIAIQFDGDGQHLISEIEKILDPVLEGDVDCMIGSRFLQDHDSFRPASIRMIGIRLLRAFSFLLIRQGISDQTSGFRAYNKRCIEFFAEQYPDHYPEPELIIMLGRHGFKISEVFTQMRERQGGVSSIPVWKGPYYIIRVLLAMLMAYLRTFNHSLNK